MIFYYLYETSPSKPISVYMGPHSSDRIYFGSISEARESNCHGVYKDRVRYKIAKVEVVTQVNMLDSNIDPPKQDEIQEYEKSKEIDAIVSERLAEYEKTLTETDPFKRLDIIFHYEMAVRMDISIKNILNREISINPK